MKLRNLKIEDAPLMLEWMHDPSVVRDLQTHFASKTLADCQQFIIRSVETGGEDRHFAITDDADDTYLGTVSLKHITNGTAEFAITIRQCAMGKNIARDAMKEIIRFGFEELKLVRIYWCVSPHNLRAVRFYDKNGYVRVSSPSDAKGYTEAQRESYLWYAAERSSNSDSSCQIRQR